MAELSQSQRLRAEDSFRVALLQGPRKKGQLARAIAAVTALKPLGRRAFERRLEAALAVAAASDGGFFLENFAARRALGRKLLITVDPVAIAHRLPHRVSSDGRTAYYEDRFIGAGDWRSVLERVDSSSTYREMAQIVAADLDYARTAAYREALKRAGGPRPVERNFIALRSPERVESYFRYCAELCRSIEEHGVVRRQEAPRTTGLFGNLMARRPWVEMMEADIGVAIGPMGEIYRFSCGKHRTAAAQALRVKTMPAEVRLVHVAWLQAQIDRSGLSPVQALLRGVRSLGLRDR